MNVPLAPIKIYESRTRYYKFFFRLLLSKKHVYSNCIFQTRKKKGNHSTTFIFTSLSKPLSQVQSTRIIRTKEKKRINTVKQLLVSGIIDNRPLMRCYRSYASSSSQAGRQAGTRSQPIEVCGSFLLRAFEISISRSRPVLRFPYQTSDNECGCSMRPEASH